jgi:L-malate glycosyltransferase
MGGRFTEKLDACPGIKNGNQMLSFLFVDTEKVWRGGQDQLLTLLKGLHRRGHQIHLVCQPKMLLETRAREMGILVHPIAIHNEIGLISFIRLVLALRRIRPDILAFNTPKAILAGTLASRIVPVRARIVFRRVNFPLRKNFFSRIKYTWAIDRVVAISESIRLQLQACGVPASKISTIYEGMDLSLYPKPNESNKRRSDKPAIIGTVAHLSQEKGLKYLIEAASLISSVDKKLRFIIVGDGACLQELKDLVHKKDLENCFQFTGFLPNTSTFMKSFDIFVLPSLSEGLSSSILEAMANSLPVVATRVGGIPELVKNGDNGLLVAPGDPAGLARAIEQLAANPEESRRMGQRGRELMEEKFTLERKILETEQLCCSFIQEHTHLRAAHG